MVSHFCCVSFFKKKGWGLFGWEPLIGCIWYFALAKAYKARDYIKAWQGVFLSRLYLYINALNQS